MKFSSSRMLASQPVAVAALNYGDAATTMLVIYSNMV